MKTVLEAAREVDVLFDLDVAVVGGGSAGVGAALAAARNGAKTVLIENFAALGGSQTLSVNPTYSFVDDRIQGGIIQEIIDDLDSAGANYNSSPGLIRAHWGRLESGGVYFDSEFYKILLDSKMQEAGVTVLFHTLAADVIREGAVLKGLLVESPQGRNAILAKTIIDCTGIGHTVRISGASLLPVGFPDDKFGPFKGQRMGFNFGLYLDNINYLEFRAFAEKNEAEWDFWVKGKKTFARARQDGRLYLGRNSCLMVEYSNGRAWVLGPNYVHADDKEPWMAEVMSEAEIDLRKQAWSLLRLLKTEVPGFQNARIETTPIKLYMRDASRMEGEYVLTEEDMNPDLSPAEDAVACSNMPVDVFFPNGSHRFRFDITPYDIPYRCLVSKTYDNLMSAGAVISSDLYAWTATRYCTPAVCTGQAAGTAAAIAAKQGVSPKQINVKDLQQSLIRQGLIISKSQLDPEVIAEYKLRAKIWPEAELVL